MGDAIVNQVTKVQATRPSNLQMLAQDIGNASMHTQLAKVTCCELAVLCLLGCLLPFKEEFARAKSGWMRVMHLQRMGSVSIEPVASKGTLMLAADTDHVKRKVLQDTRAQIAASCPNSCSTHGLDE